MVTNVKVLRAPNCNFTRPWSPPVLIPEQLWALSKASTRLTTMPQGLLKRRAVWKTTSGLIIGSYFFRKAQGTDSILQPCDKHQTPWREDQTDGLDWGQGTEHLVSKVKLICSSSAWNHSFDGGYCHHFYIFNLMHISLSGSSISQFSFTFWFPHSPPAPSFPFCLLDNVFF